MTKRVKYNINMPLLADNETLTKVKFEFSTDSDFILDSVSRTLTSWDSFPEVTLDIDNDITLFYGRYTLYIDRDGTEVEIGPSLPEMVDLVNPVTKEYDTLIECPLVSSAAVYSLDNDVTLISSELVKNGQELQAIKGEWSITGTDSIPIYDAIKTEDVLRFIIPKDIIEHKVNKLLIGGVTLETTNKRSTRGEVLLNEPLDIYKMNIHGKLFKDMKSSLYITSNFVMLNEYFYVIEDVNGNLIKSGDTFNQHIKIATGILTDNEYKITVRANTIHGVKESIFNVHPIEIGDVANKSSIAIIDDMSYEYVNVLNPYNYNGNAGYGNKIILPNQSLSRLELMTPNILQDGSIRYYAEESVNAYFDSAIHSESEFNVTNITEDLYAISFFNINSELVVIFILKDYNGKVLRIIRELQTSEVLLTNMTSLSPTYANGNMYYVTIDNGNNTLVIINVHDYTISTKDIDTPVELVNVKVARYTAGMLLIYGKGIDNKLYIFKTIANGTIVDTEVYGLGGDYFFVHNNHGNKTTEGVSGVFTGKNINNEYVMFRYPFGNTDPMHLPEAFRGLIKTDGKILFIRN